MGFCIYCGKKLEEGEVCECEGAKKAAERKNDFSENVSNATAAGTEAVGKAKVALLNILKAPVTEGVSYMDGTNFITSVAMIVVQAILSGLFAIVMAGKYNKIVKGLKFGLFDLSGLKIGGIKAFFLTLLFSLIISALFACIFFLVGEVIKLEMNFKTAVDLAGIRSSFLCASTVLAVVFGLIIPAAGTAIFYGCGLLVAVIIGCILVKKYEGHDNKMAYATVVGMVVFLLVCAFIMSKACSLYLPKDIFGSLSYSSLLSF